MNSTDMFPLNKMIESEKFNLKPEKLRLERRKNYSGPKAVKFRMDYSGFFEICNSEYYQHTYMHSCLSHDDS